MFSQLQQSQNEVCVYVRGKDAADCEDDVSRSELWSGDSCHFECFLQKHTDRNTSKEDYFLTLLRLERNPEQSQY